MAKAMEETTSRTGRRAWSRAERALLWATGILLLLGIGGFVWIRSANDLPTASIPTPTLPSPNAFDFYVRAGEQSVGNPMSGSGTPTTAQLAAALPANEPALKTFREGMKHPYRHPPIRSLYAEIPHFAPLRELARLIVLEGKVRESRHDYGGAADSYLDGLYLGQDVPRGGTLIASLVGLACEAIVRRPFWELSEKLSAADARRAAKRLEQMEAKRHPFVETVREDKWATQAGILELFKGQNAFTAARGLSNLTFTPSSPGVWRDTFILMVRGKKRIYRDYTDYMDAMIAEMGKPYVPAAMLPEVPDDPINHSLAVPYDSARIKVWDAIMQTNLLTATLALRAYRLEKGDYPASLDALVSGGYLTKVPDDPFAGTGPLRYRRVSKDRYVLYSVGPDGKDDGGKPIAATTGSGTPKRWAEAGMTGDFVARINTY
jgi:hypothetical protein